MSPILGIIASQNYPRVTNSYESIATVTVGSGGVTEINFTSIPSTYTHLQLRYLTKAQTGQNSFVKLQINGDTGANYSRHSLRGNGAAVSASSSVSRTANMNLTGIGNSADDTHPEAGVIDLLDYANTNKYKTVRCLAGIDYNGGGDILLSSGLWMSTSAITSLKIYDSTYGQYSSFALYGIRGA